MKKEKKVGLITIDTYRIAAVEQLKTFAKIIGIPIEVVYKKDDIDQILNKYKHFDVILIDTVGRSQKDLKELKSLKDFINDLNVDELHLLLSLTTKYSDMKDIVRSFSVFSFEQDSFYKA